MSEALVEVLDVYRDRFERLDIQGFVGEKEVVPYPHGFEDRYRYEGGLHYGEHYLEEGAQGTRAVNVGSLLDLYRYRFYESREHEHSQARAEAEINYHQRPRRVELEHVSSARKRSHNYLERDYHREDAEVVDYLAHECV